MIETSAAVIEPEAKNDGPGRRRDRRRSQRIAWWLLKAARLSCTFRERERCGGPVASSYSPNPRQAGGLELRTRCSICGWSVLQLCQPHGERVPFVPTLPWQAIEDEIATMRGVPIPTQH
jgi:hypothetical protein